MHIMTLDPVCQLYMLEICILYAFECIQNYYHYIPLVLIKDIKLYPLQLDDGLSLNFAYVDAQAIFTHSTGL